MKEKLSEKMDSPVDYIAGLRKVGPATYRVVSGKIVNGVVELKVDHLEQSLEYSAEGLKTALHNLIGAIP